MKRKKFAKIKGRIKDGRKVYSTTEALEIFDLKWGRFRQWLKLGYIKADEPTKAQGSSNFFIKENLYTIKLFIILISLGLNRWFSSDAAHEVGYEQWSDISYQGEPIWMIISGDPDHKRDKNWKKNMELYFWPGPDLKLDKFQGAIVIDLLKIAKEIDEKVG